MTEITRVPLQPIAKGSLTKMWLGVFAAALAAGGIAWAAMPVSVNVTTLVAGTGASPTLEDIALINYKGTLPDGKVFDQAEHAIFPLQGVVPGFTKALLQMQKGGKYKVLIPSELAYGPKDQKNPQTGEVAIPGGSDLTFEIELLDFQNRAVIEQQQAAMQQMQQLQAQQHGGRRAPPPGAEGQMPEGAMPAQ
jgi:FKBP-type peptidyl-prolyl cis-trans isomerase FkpA